MQRFPIQTITTTSVNGRLVGRYIPGYIVGLDGTGIPADQLINAQTIVAGNLFIVT